jgi:hypothetical protein
MAPLSQDLVGHDVYARDGVKAGQIKDLAYAGEYFVLRRSFFSTIVVPVGLLEESGGRPTIPLSSSYLDNAPKIDVKKDLSPTDRAHLDSFYLRRAA